MASIFLVYFPFFLKDLLIHRKDIDMIIGKIRNM
jgi:hypothetical protein